MSSLTLNPETMSSSPWRADASSAWSLQLDPRTPAYVSREQGTAIAAQAVSGALPFAQWSFSPPLALQEPRTARLFTELRFWLHSDRPADGSAEKPFYLAFEASSDASGEVWQRFIPVQQRRVWELHRLWLGDMPPTMRRSISRFTLRSLDGSIAFNASLGDVIASISEPLQDVDMALRGVLHLQFQALIEPELSAQDVEALIELPESPGARTFPYFLIIPWSVLPLQERGGSGELIDNYTQNGAYVRPHLSTVQLDYAIDVYAQSRRQKTSLLDQVLNYFSRHPFLVVNGEPLDMWPFAPSSEELTQFTNPIRRTPLFYRLTIQLETGDRQLRQRAVPFITVNPQKSSTDRDRSNPEPARI